MTELMSEQFSERDRRSESPAGLGLYDEHTLAALQVRLSQTRENFPHIPFPSRPLRSLRDLCFCPVMTKTDCEAARLPANPENVIVFNSGGSSGRYSYYFMRPQDVVEKGRIGTELALHRLPDPGDKRYLYLNLMSGSGAWSGGVVCTMGVHPWSINYSPINRGINEAVKMTDILLSSIRETVAGMVVMGPPAELLELVKLMGDRGKQDRWPVVKVAFGAQGLTQTQLSFINQVFDQATIHSILSSSEGNAFGFSYGTDIRTLTVLPRSCFIWLRDEETGLPIEEPGRAGEIVVSNLYCRYYPLNFLSNDRGEWIEPYQTFRQRGRRADLISLNGGSAGVEGQFLKEAVLERTGAIDCQFHLRAAGELLIDAVVSQAKRLLSDEELHDMVLEVAKLTNPQQIRASFKTHMREGDMERTKVGKIMTVIDHREI